MGEWDRKPRIHRIWRVGEHWCVVADNGMAFYLGYVSVPEGHPWYGQPYDDIPADAHGGLTFSDTRGWESFEGADDGVPDGWYVGFDFGHFCDKPIIGSPMEKYWIRPPGGFIHAWTVESVANEVQKLAVQAQVAAVVAGVV
jgi:hypothetical protein